MESGDGGGRKVRFAEDKSAPHTPVYTREQLAAELGRPVLGAVAPPRRVKKVGLPMSKTLAGGADPEVAEKAMDDFRATMVRGRVGVAGGMALLPASSPRPGGSNGAQLLMATLTVGDGTNGSPAKPGSRNAFERPPAVSSVPRPGQAVQGRRGLPARKVAFGGMGTRPGPPPRSTAAMASKRREELLAAKEEAMRRELARLTSQGPPAFGSARRASTSGRGDAGNRAGGRGPSREDVETAIGLLQKVCSPIVRMAVGGEAVNAEAFKSSLRRLMDVIEKPGAFGDSEEVYHGIVVRWAVRFAKVSNTRDLKRGIKLLIYLLMSGHTDAIDATSKEVMRCLGNVLVKGDEVVRDVALEALQLVVDQAAENSTPFIPTPTLADKLTAYSSPSSPGATRLKAVKLLASIVRNSAAVYSVAAVVPDGM